MKRRCWSLLAAVLLSAANGLSAQSARGAPTGRCEACHGELEFLRQHTASLDLARALHVPARTLAGSGHRDMGCAECHTGFNVFPHSANATSRTCQDCHQAETAAWQRGSHAGTDGREPVACAECHGIHDAAPTARLRTADGARDMNRICTDCHEPHRLERGPHADSVACSGCHGPHEVKRMNEPGSTLATQRQAVTCGACHQDVVKTWLTDVHGSAVLRGQRNPAANADEDAQPPDCTTCHGGHGIAISPDSTLEVAGQQRCAGCHGHYAETFGESYHGQAATLEDGDAAVCSDCHSAHAIHPTDDPRSSVAAANLIKTCGSCHPNANAGFIQFEPHANTHDAEESPLLFWTYRFMTALLIGVMSVFGLHSIVWVMRVAIDRARARRAATQGGKP